MVLLFNEIGKSCNDWRCQGLCAGVPLSRQQPRPPGYRWTVAAQRPAAVTHDHQQHLQQPACRLILCPQPAQVHAASTPAHLTAIRTCTHCLLPPGLNLCALTVSGCGSPQAITCIMPSATKRTSVAASTCSMAVPHTMYGAGFCFHMHACQQQAISPNDLTQHSKSSMC